MVESSSQVGYNGIGPGISPREESSMRSLSAFRNIQKLSAFALGLLLLVASLPVNGEPEAKLHYLVIHADDAGMSHSVNMATIEAMEKGIVTSVSIMVPCPWFVEFAEYAKQHPEGDFGVHLTLNCEWKRYRWGPVAPRSKVPSLLDKQGYLYNSVPEVAEHAKLEEVEIELRAQIDRALKFGVPLSHLDTHMGAMVSRPDLLELYVKLGVEYDLPILFTRTITERLRKQYPALQLDAAPLIARLEKQRLPLLDQLLQFYSGGTHEERRAQYLQAIRDLPVGSSQIIIHCGIDNSELRAITNSAANRDSDRRVFTDPEFIAVVRRLDVKLVGWKQLHEMAKGK
jgi:predicted glycoside hydrolase/deacetylase ChbG (UPF0249 family)